MSRNDNRTNRFKPLFGRIGKVEVKKWLSSFCDVPPYQIDASFYSDWRDPREFTLGDIGKGECAGEVVSSLQFGLADSEREVFEAQLKLDERDAVAASALAYAAMLTAARTLIRQRDLNISTDESDILGQFQKHFVDTKLFHDPYAGGKFGQFLFSASQRQKGEKKTDEIARRDIEEAQLFIEASHTCYARMSQQESAT